MATPSRIIVSKRIEYVVLFPHSAAWEEPPHAACFWRMVQSLQSVVANVQRELDVLVQLRNGFELFSKETFEPTGGPELRMGGPTVEGQGDGASAGLAPDRAEPLPPVAPAAQQADTSSPAAVEPTGGMPEGPALCDAAPACITKDGIAEVTRTLRGAIARGERDMEWLTALVFEDSEHCLWPHGTESDYKAMEEWSKRLVRQALTEQLRDSYRSLGQEGAGGSAAKPASSGVTHGPAQDNPYAGQGRGPP